MSCTAENAADAFALNFPHIDCTPPLDKPARSAPKPNAPCCGADGVDGVFQLESIGEFEFLLGAVPTNDKFDGPGDGGVGDGVAELECNENAD